MYGSRTAGHGRDGRDLTAVVQESVAVGVLAVDGQHDGEIARHGSERLERVAHACAVRQSELDAVSAGALAQRGEQSGR